MSVGMLARVRDERALLESLLSRVEVGSLICVWPDGSESRFGSSAPCCRVRWSVKGISRTLAGGTPGFCGGYVDGDWTIVEGTLLGFLTSMVSANLHEAILARMSPMLHARLAFEAARCHISFAATHKAVRAHYDLDTEFFAAWLDGSMTYTCGYAVTAEDSLETMQQQKLELVCRKLRLAPGQTLLDLGCGWGSLAIYAAKTRGARVVAVNISAPQLAYLRETAVREGVGELVDIRHMDYREVSGTFDRIAAIGMAEHVGKRQLRRFMRHVSDRLSPTGLALVHTIGSCAEGGTDPWLERQIFPGSYVPTLSELMAAAEASRLRTWHVENLGLHYAVTLEHWHARFQAARPEIRGRFGESFCRIWELYLAMLVPTFRYLSTSLFQIVLSRGPGAFNGANLADFGGDRSDLLAPKVLAWPTTG